MIIMVVKIICNYHTSINNYKILKHSTMVPIEIIILYPFYDTRESSSTIGYIILVDARLFFLPFKFLRCIRCRNVIQWIPRND